MQPSLIIKPLTTEKAVAFAKRGKYLFLVEDHAEKITLKDLIGKLYNVEVTKINVLRTHPKTKLGRSGKPSVKRHAFKKVIVTVKGGKNIDVYKLKESKK